MAFTSDSVKAKVLNYLLSGRTITGLQGFELFKTMNVRNRISELRNKDGYAIQRELLRDDMTGKQYCKYWIKAEDITKYNQQGKEAI